MSFNDSFIKEVSEEVQRDKLYKFFKKYLWVGIFFVIILISAVGINEWRKNSTKISNEINGDKLSFALKTYIKDKNYENYISYINENNPGRSLAILNPEFLNSESNREEKLRFLGIVENDENLPIVLRDLALLYKFYLGQYNNNDKFQILNELSGPDRPFRFLAIESKIDLYLEEGLFKDALQEIEILQKELSGSFSIKDRINNLKSIIEAQIE